MSCTEYDLSNIARIEAYPVGDLSFDAPIYVMKPTASSSIIEAPGTPVKFTKGSAKCQDKTSVSVAGRTHEVSLEWETVTMTEEAYDTLCLLQNVPHEFVLTYFGGVQRVIRTDAIPYKFSFDDSDGKMKCRATLVNGQGLTLLT